MASEKKIDVVILGLLNHEPLTGYEIKKKIDHSLTFFWNGSFGSIYPTLSLLEKEGAIKKVGSEDCGRGKITYAITENGKQQLRNWLSIPTAKDEMKYETILKIFFGGELGKEGTMAQLLNFESKIKTDLSVLEFFEKNLENCLEEDEDHLYFLLTVRFGIETYKGHLKWCEDAKRILSKGLE